MMENLCLGISVRSVKSVYINTINTEPNQIHH